MRVFFIPLLEFCNESLRNILESECAVGGWTFVIVGASWVVICVIYFKHRLDHVKFWVDFFGFLNIIMLNDVNARK